MTFRPGESGNPKGRKRGTKLTSTKLREHIAAELPGIIATLVEAAQSGDTNAARLLLDRSLAPLKRVDPAIRLNLPADPGAAAQAMMAAIASGTVEPTTGARLIAALGTVAELRDLKDLEARLSALEART